MTDSHPGSHSNQLPPADGRVVKMYCRQTKATNDLLLLMSTASILCVRPCLRSPVYKLCHTTGARSCRCRKPWSTCPRCWSWTTWTCCAPQRPRTRALRPHHRMRTPSCSGSLMSWTRFGRRTTCRTLVHAPWLFPCGFWPGTVCLSVCSSMSVALQQPSVWIA